MAIFAQMMDGVVDDRLGHQTIMIDAIYLKTHRTAPSLPIKKGAQAA